MLGIRFDIKENPFDKTILFYDLTGSYSVNTNVTGYGGPNPAVNQFDTTTLTFVFGSPSKTVNLVIPSGLPTTDVTTGYVIDPVPLGLGEYPQGVTTVTYAMRAIGTKELLKVTSEFLFTSGIECCIAKLSAETPKDCKCLSKRSLNPLLARMYLELSKTAFYEKGLREESIRLLDYAETFCDCKCGCS